MTLRKHRDEIEAFGVDYEPRLDTDETLSGTPTVRVHRVKDQADVSAEFHIANITIVDGTLVQFTLGAAGDGTEQLAGEYWIYVKADTSDSEELVETPKLEVTAEGSIA